jgi:hypothetical protein
MKIIEIIGVRNLILIRAKIAGIWLFLAAPKIVLEEKKRAGKYCP